MSSTSERRVLVGLDGSEDARVALDRAIDLARALDAEVIAVHALGLLERVGRDRSIPTASHREEIDAHFEQEWCAPLTNTGLRCRQILRDGTPLDVLLAVGDAEDVDYVVVGSRGIGGASAQALGSTSHQLATRSARPVVIVPRDSRSTSTD